MRILIVHIGAIPVQLYGGIERVIWALGKELVKLGHDVTFLVKQGSYCDFANVLHINEHRPILEQITKDYDIVHFSYKPNGLELINFKYIITIHGNSNTLDEQDRNTVFVSKNHALRHNSNSYVHNGLDWNDYLSPDLNKKRHYFHFLGNAAWRVKNVSGAISIIKKTPSEKLKILGGVRFNFKMGIRFTFSPRVSFAGEVGGDQKCKLLNESKGLIFPVKWHEPFGLAITESLYYGCPVFGTPYGSLPEIITKDVGFLSAKSDELAAAILQVDDYSRQRCHEYARDEFNSKKMAAEYFKKYEKVIAGENLNSSPPKLAKAQEEKWLKWE